MRQVTQRLRDGRIEVLDVPAPRIGAEEVLVDVRASLLSAGTERTKVATGRQSLVGKARARPDQVRQVIDKAQRDGLRETVATVRGRLDQPAAIGYSAAGVALEVGDRVRGVAAGDRVACGGETAVHSELIAVPGNLCVPLPDGVGFDLGAFATVGSVALHGVRQADVRLGERVAVIGLGLVGQLTGQLLRASGCEVVGIDLDSGLVAQALETGAADAAYQRGALDGVLPAPAEGCDAAIVTAATPSADPVELAARLCRDRGRVVVVGDVGMSVPRAPYYEKELELRLSRSYGPGRYDPDYEQRGLDYPIGYVRWTERRNMGAFVELLVRGSIDVRPLITDRVPIERAEQAYARLVEDGTSPLGLLLQYEPNDLSQPPAATAPAAPLAASPMAVGVIGAGSFAQRVLIPGLQRAGFPLRAVASSAGLSAKAAAERFGFATASTVEQLIADPRIGLAAIATRHASHAELAARALRAGKHVFVEKPPALDEAQLEDLREAVRTSGRHLAVGFNRRHAPFARALRDHVRRPGQPIELLLRVNAGPLPPDHWLHDPADGGGRLLGEGCHFVDFACWVVGALPERVAAAMPAGGGARASAQRFTVALQFHDGSVATLLYGDAAAPRMGKELYEAHAGGRSGTIDDFRRLTLLGGRRRAGRRVATADKGHVRQLVHLGDVLRGVAAEDGPSPLDTMAVTLTALRTCPEMAGRGSSLPAMRSSSLPDSDA